MNYVLKELLFGFGMLAVGAACFYFLVRAGCDSSVAAVVSIALVVGWGAFLKDYVL